MSVAEGQSARTQEGMSASWKIDLRSRSLTSLTKCSSMRGVQAVLSPSQSSLGSEGQTCCASVRESFDMMLGRWSGDGAGLMCDELVKNAVRPS